MKIPYNALSYHVDTDRHTAIKKVHVVTQAETTETIQYSDSSNFHKRAT